MTVYVQSREDLHRLQMLSGQSDIVLDLSRIKYHGLSLLALRQAYCATRLGGTITIVDRSAPTTQAIEPFLIGWPTIRALAITALGECCELDPTSKPGNIRFRRNAAQLGRGWSAGIIFSGNDNELPALYRCIDGLAAQSELRGSSGEILVCGPTRDMGFLDPYTEVKYINFDFEQTESAFPISRKKNVLLRAMKNPRRLVLHTRIVMDPGALASAPTEFDILAPNILQRSNKGTESNIGLVCIDSGWPTLTPRRFERSTTNAPDLAYLDLYAQGRPYVDGGAFAVADRVFSKCALRDGLLWGDCEDVEWCFRAQSLGFAVDMAPGMRAVNTVPKNRTLEAWPLGIARSFRAVNRAKRGMQNLIRRMHGAKAS